MLEQRGYQRGFAGVQVREGRRDETRKLEIERIQVTHPDAAAEFDAKGLLAQCLGLIL